MRWCHLRSSWILHIRLEPRAHRFCWTWLIFPMELASYDHGSGFLLNKSTSPSFLRKTCRSLNVAVNDLTSGSCRRALSNVFHPPMTDWLIFIEGMWCWRIFILQVFMLKNTYISSCNLMVSVWCILNSLIIRLCLAKCRIFSFAPKQHM